jgi:hypothetical protein
MEENQLDFSYIYLYLCVYLQLSIVLDYLMIQMINALRHHYQNCSMSF